MGAMSIHGLAILLGRLLLAGTFLLAGLPKIQDPATFAASIEAYRIVSGPAALWAALLLPWLEVIIGIGLLTPWLERASSTIIILLLALFIGLHSSAWMRGLDISCGCFGESGTGLDYHWSILRNLALLAVTAFILRSSLRNKTHPHHS